MQPARLLDWLYRPRCASCGVPVTATEPLCGTCSISLYPLDAACPRCSEPYEQPSQLECRRCRKRPPAFARLVAPYRYGGELAEAVKAFKYGDRADLARPLGALLRPCLEGVLDSADRLVPVPLHWRRLARRRFNQSQLLAEACGPAARRKLDAGALRRVRASPTQAGASEKARREHVALAFLVPARQRARLAGQHVVVLDDIATTGATANAAASALRRAGAAKVTAVCLARAVYAG